nr:carboxypeptidase-like regulatory domain-containing protein [Kofleriaceae bacterium]
HAKAGVELTLGAGAVVKGKVVDSAGSAIAGAHVRAVVRGNVNWREQRQALTATDGTFSIAGLSRRDVEVVAAHLSGSSAVVVANLATNATVDLTLTLDVVGAIDGTVVDQTGQGVGDAQVIAEPVYDGGLAARATWTVRGVQQVVTDQGGGFHFAGLPDGLYRVRAARPGASEAALDLANSVEARPGGAKLKLVVTADSKIVGRVAFKDGKVPLSFTVAIGASYPTPFASPDGRFELASPTGSQTIVVDGKNFLAAKARDVMVASGKVADVGTIVVEPGRSVSGRVLDEAGVPIAGAKVAAGTLLTGGGQELYIPDESIGAKDAVTDERGRYRIEGFSPAQITVVAGKDNIGRSASVQLPSGADSANLDLVLHKTGGLDGVITSNGKPLADTIVIANPIGATHANFFSTTGADGTFALDALAAGPYIVYPIIGGGGMRPKDMYIVRVDVVLGTRAHVTIDASPGPVTLAVSVKSEVGAAIPMAQLFLVAADVVAAVTNSTDMRSLDQLATFSAKPTALAMRSAMGGAGEIVNVTPGVHTLCVVPLSGMPDPNGPPMPAKCQLVNVGAAAKQDVQVVIPAAMLPK